MSPKKSKLPSRDARPVNSRWVRCPRSPCLVSYNPRSAQRHASACRYFRCPNQSCHFLGTQTQVSDHESGCLYGLASEEIGTTDPLSESPSDVLDILTSPNRFHSYPTDLSSSPPKCPSPWQSRKRQSVRSKQSKGSLGAEASTHLNPIASTSTLTKDHGSTRRRLDPYDPSAQRIFSLPAESIKSLRPVPPPSKSSSPLPPPPTRRLSTYELQRYRPEPASTHAGSSYSIRRSPEPKNEVAAALAHTTALYESLKKCYQSLLYTYDDYTYLVSQKASQCEIPEGVVGPTIEDFQQAFQSFSANEVPDLSFLTNLDCRADNELAGEPEEEEAREASPEPAAEDGQTADQLADQVRMKIAQRKRRAPAGMDSPGNVFSRKRPRDTRDSSPLAPSNSPQRPTLFMQKLADTTWELSDEIPPALPSCCNFNKLLDQAKLKIQHKLKNRKSC